MFIYSRRDNVSRPRSTAKLLFTCTSAELLLFFQSVQERTKRQVSDGLSLEMEIFYLSNIHLQVNWQVRQHQL